MRRRTVELAVVLVVAMGVEAREASLRARERIYCAPVRVGVAAVGGSLWPAEDGALKGRRYTDGEINSPLQGLARLKLCPDESGYSVRRARRGSTWAARRAGR